MLRIRSMLRYFLKPHPFHPRHFINYINLFFLFARIFSSWNAFWIPSKPMKLAIELRARPDKAQELYQALQALLPTIRSEKGCRDCRVYRDVEDGEVYSLTVDWEARESLEQYMRSGSGGALLGALDLLSEKAKVRLGQDSPWEGIDSLKRMRKKT